MWELAEYLINGLVTASVYILVALGLALIFGILEILQFAHGEVYMIGAYLIYTFVRFLGLNYLLSMAIGVCLTALVGIFIEVAVFRPIRGKPLFLPIISALGLGMAFMDLSRLTWSPETLTFDTFFKRTILNFGSVSVSAQRILIIITAMILITLLYLFITRTIMGKALRAASMDLEATSLMGINVNTVIMITFAIGSALAAAAGGLLAPISSLVPHMGTMVGLKAFAIIIFGGFGDIRGIVVAGLIVGIGESLTVGYISSLLRDSVAFIILVFVLLLRPSGIFGTKSGRLF
jgi:branched-chain amino acid transport system permease protein